MVPIILTFKTVRLRFGVGILQHYTTWIDSPQSQGFGVLSMDGSTESHISYHMHI